MAAKKISSDAIAKKSMSNDTKKTKSTLAAGLNFIHQMHVAIVVFSF
jgi:hypothetical protein